MQKQYQDNEKNEELTIKAQNDPRYVAYVSWLRKNGAIFTGIDFPVAFGNCGYIGVAAKEDIPPNKIIVAIPNNLLLSTALLDECPLKIIVDKNPKLFNLKDNYDADFNKLTLFLMAERLKGDDSFWHPYLNIAPDEFTLLDWSDEELERIDDPFLLQQFHEYKDSMEDSWIELQAILKKYPELFPPESTNKKLYYWCYQFVTTRCYGWNFPHTLLVPLADAFNHSKQGNSNLIMQLQYEKEEVPKPADYIIKHHDIDCSIFEGFKYDRPVLDKIHSPPNIKQAYILKQQQKKILKKKGFADEQGEKQDQTINEDQKEISQTKSDCKALPQAIFQEDYLKQEIQRINGEKLKNSEEKLWELPYFTSSETEDNDTEESDKEDNFENNEQYAMLKARESITVQANLKEDEVEDKKLEELEELKEISQKTHSREKYKHHLSESTWTWYNLKDHLTYFTVSCPVWQKQDQQIFHCYGRRTNRFLMIWYGFSLPNNPYDSYPFRLWSYMKYPKAQLEQNIEQIVFSDYICDEEYDDGIEWEGKIREVDQLTKEFRLKETSVCLDLLAYIRVFIQSSQNILKEPLAFTLPTSLKLEATTISFARKIIKVLYDRVCTESVLDEIDQIENAKDFRRIIVLNLLKGQTKILRRQLQATRVLENVIQGMLAGESIENAVGKQYNEIEETDEDYAANRYVIREYIRMVYFGIVKQKHI